ncbi:hypothetical protein KIF24_29060 [Micromonospora sp. Llam7]|uniref:hypothetical protein n=1 Tax=Micromonospora tarapacensis TaxID=2835305 RepID=UPI001C836A78|nr:hypothetical protein [Micromonospora tarapacensis]MBX7269664.1 hypothetical protein [Micromonospora tarapacensis]
MGDDRMVAEAAGVVADAGDRAGGDRPRRITKDLELVDSFTVKASDVPGSTVEGCNVSVRSREVVMTRETVLFVVCLLGMAVSSSVLILLVPSLFQPGERISLWVVGVPACIAVGFAVGSLHWRPSR